MKFETANDAHRRLTSTYAWLRDKLVYISAIRGNESWPTDDTTLEFRVGDRWYTDITRLSFSFSPTYVNMNGSVVWVERTQGRCQRLGMHSSNTAAFSLDGGSVSINGTLAAAMSNNIFTSVGSLFVGKQGALNKDWAVRCVGTDEFQVFHTGQFVGKLTAGEMLFMDKFTYLTKVLYENNPFHS